MHPVDERFLLLLFNLGLKHSIAKALNSLQDAGATLHARHGYLRGSVTGLPAAGPCPQGVEGLCLKLGHTRWPAACKGDGLA
jgi:hypothetical protein